jgi:hypothetical protein
VIRGTGPSPSELYGPVTTVHLPAGSAPILFVVVDTEEEFDWAAPLSRERTGVDHMLRIGRIQSIFDRYGVKPTYVIDYPVASQPNGFTPLREIAQSGRCTIGAHLHPWVTPPMAEDVNGANSFTCNLPVALQKEKLEAVADAIRRNLGVEARVYKAGRYGIGRSTIELLDALGFDVDQSIMPHYDFSAERGPSFRRFTADPFLFGPRRTLALPCSCAYVGAAGRAAPLLYDLAVSPSVAWTRLPGILTRARLADRLVLTPEGFSADDMKRVARALVGRGCRTLTMSLHSPSVEPGHTPYVSSEQEMKHFFGRIESFLDYFFGPLGGTTTTPEAFRRTALETISS